MSAFAAAYLNNRISAARRAPIPVGTAVDLARSDLDDDQLEEAARVLGAQDPPNSWGFAEMFDEWLSREPNRQPVGDLASLQESLKAQGFLSPNYQATGVWDPVSTSAFKRWQRDGLEKTMLGEKPGAASLSKIMDYIGHTLPSSVFQGVVGTAKGLVQQTSETPERLGLVGGVGAGAGLGGAAAGAGGVLVGAIGGGLWGFVADLVDDDSDIPDQDGWHKFLDALTPYDEYRNNSKAFWEDLGYVATALALVASRGSAGAALGAARSGGAGVGAKTLALALRRPAIGGAAGGAVTEVATQKASGKNLDYSELLTSTAIGGALGHGIGRFAPTANAADNWIGFVEKRGLNQFVAKHPLLQRAQAGYTGASTFQMGGRLFGGAMQKDHTSAIEAGIDESERLPEWVDYTVGLVLYPSQMLPFRGSEVTRAAGKALGEAPLEPWIRVLQKSIPGKTLSRGEARREFFRLADSETELALIDNWHRLDAGIKHEAASKVIELGGSPNPLARRKRFKDTIASIRREINAEGGAGQSETAKRLVKKTYEDDTILEAHLKEIEGIGSGIKRWGVFYDDSRLLQDLQSDWERGLVQLEIPADAKLAGGRDFESLKLQTKAQSLESQARKLEREAKGASGNLTAAQREERLEKATSLVTEAKELRAQVVKPKKGTTRNLVVARNDYLTQQQLNGFAGEYERLATQYEKAFGAYRKQRNPQTSRAMMESEDELFALLDDLEARDAVPNELIAKARQPKPMRSVSGHLREYAEMQGSEVYNLPQAISEKVAVDGYKVIAVGEDITRVNDLPRLLEVTGVNDYSRRQAFFATIRSLGIDPKVRSDEALFKLRAANTKAELQQVLDTNNVRMTGASAWSDINQFVHDRNHPGKIRDENVSSLGPFVIRNQPGRRTKLELFKVDPRELSVDDIVEALDLERHAADPFAVGKKLYHALHKGAAFGGEAHLFQNPLTTAREIGRVLGVNGLQGVGDFIRTAHLPDVGPFAENTFGYLPQHLHRLNMALRYTLSPTFDIGRYVEQNMLGAIKGDLPVIIRPHRFVTRGEWKSPYSAGTVTGDEAWNHAINFWDEVNGSNVFQITDDIERRMFQTGLFGFSPRHHEAAQAFVLYQRGVPKEKIRETIYGIGRYGLGRSAAEKSANFIFFPFSFQKKLLASLGDWMFSAPARAMLIHTGLKWFSEFGLTEEFGAATEKYFPLFDELKQLNNLAYGASPGRFFLEGLADNKTKAGSAMQIIASVMAPSGAATPLAQAAGKIGDRTIHAFAPVVVTGEKIPDLWDILESFAPLPRDVRDYADVFYRQGKVLREGADPYFQQTAYLEGKKAAKAPYDAMAHVLGYAEAESLFDQPGGDALEAQYNDEVFALQDEYPTGWELSRTYTEDASVKKKVLNDLASDPDRSTAEEALVRLGEIEAQGKALAETMNVAQADVYPMVMSLIRAEAVAHQADARFVALYNEFFSDDYGPLQAIAAA